MTRPELDIAIEWAANEGWNPGLHDADVFWQTDPQGYIVLEKNDEVIGSGSIVSYDGHFGFMGFFIVKPEERGQGLGTELWYFRRDKLLNRLKEGAAIGMDGVFDMQDFYTKGGFRFSHRNLRMEGKAERSTFDKKKIREITKKDFDAINPIDREHFGFDRTTFLRGWLSLNDSARLMYSEKGEILGYGVIRRCRSGYKIGPLFAKNFEVAENLYRALANFAEGSTIYLDIPEINRDAVRLSKKYDLKESFGCARMYYGKAPDLPYSQIYGVATFELG